MSYESSLKAQRDYYASMSYVKKEGIEEGIERGIERGKREGKEEEIRNLIRKLGLSDKEAANVADVTVALVKKIRQELKSRG